MTVRRAVLLVALAAVATASVYGVFGNRREDAVVDAPRFGNVVSLAVLGDSGSHSYQDHILMPVSSAYRGGTFRPTTWQWTEVIAQMRGSFVDQGEWGVWGTRRTIARAMRMLGWERRTPRKQDFALNFAVSGAGCQDLMSGNRQAPQLLLVMNGDPERWRNGIVSIKIGAANIGQTAALDRFAAEGPTPPVRSEILQCVEWIREAMDLIRRDHPLTRFVLVGITTVADDPPNFDRWIAERERLNISSALDVFDEGLRAIARQDSRVVFLDDRAWVRQTWGERDASGRPAYRSVHLGGRTAVAYTMGDEPIHAIVADGHAGTAWNALWAQHFVGLLNSAFGLQIPPISTDEVAGVVDPTGVFGLRPTP